MKEFEYIIHGFINKTLPRDQWTHQAHLIVSVHFCLNYDIEACLMELRNHIKLFNQSTGTANTATSGYHETLTKFWILITKRFIDNHPQLTKEELIMKFINSEQASKNLHLAYYSPEVIFSTLARKQWIEPDLDGVFW